MEISVLTFYFIAVEYIQLWAKNVLCKNFGKIYTLDYCLFSQPVYK